MESPLSLYPSCWVLYLVSCLPSQPRSIPTLHYCICYAVHTATRYRTHFSAKSVLYVRTYIRTFVHIRAGGAVDRVVSLLLRLRGERGGVSTCPSPKAHAPLPPTSISSTDRQTDRQTDKTPDDKKDYLYPDTYLPNLTYLTLTSPCPTTTTYYLHPIPVSSIHPVSCTAICTLHPVSRLVRQLTSVR